MNSDEDSTWEAVYSNMAEAAQVRFMIESKRTIVRSEIRILRNYID